MIPLQLDTQVVREGKTGTDQFAARRRTMPRGLLAPHLGTFHILAFPAPETVYRISGVRDVFPVPPVRVNGCSTYSL